MRSISRNMRAPSSQWMNPRAAAVSPAHGNFLHAESELARQEKNLRIEAPALDLLQRQNRLRRPARERL